MPASRPCCQARVEGAHAGQLVAAGGGPRVAAYQFLDDLAGTPSRHRGLPAAPASRAGDARPPAAGEPGPLGPAGPAPTPAGLVAEVLAAGSLVDVAVGSGAEVGALVLAGAAVVGGNTVVVDAAVAWVEVGGAAVVVGWTASWVAAVVVGWATAVGRPTVAAATDGAQASRVARARTTSAWRETTLFNGRDSGGWGRTTRLAYPPAALANGHVQAGAGGSRIRLVCCRSLRVLDHIRARGPLSLSCCCGECGEVRCSMTAVARDAVLPARLPQRRRDRRPLGKQLAIRWLLEAEEDLPKREPQAAPM